MTEEGVKGVRGGEGKVKGDVCSEWCDNTYHQHQIY